MKKITLKIIIGLVICLTSNSIFSQDSENVIVLQMPDANSKAITAISPAQEVTQNENNSTEPIYIADGVVITNLNILDPSTILAVDILDNKIVITTNRKVPTDSAIASR